MAWRGVAWRGVACAAWGIEEDDGHGILQKVRRACAGVCDERIELLPTVGCQGAVVRLRHAVRGIAVMQDEPWLALYMTVYLKDLGLTLAYLRLLKQRTVTGNPFASGVSWIDKALEVHAHTRPSGPCRLASAHLRFVLCFLRALMRVLPANLAAMRRG